MAILARPYHTWKVACRNKIQVRRGYKSVVFSGLLLTSLFNREVNRQEVVQPAEPVEYAYSPTIIRVRYNINNKIVKAGEMI